MLEPRVDVGNGSASGQMASAAVALAHIAATPTVIVTVRAAFPVSFLKLCISWPLALVGSAVRLRDIGLLPNSLEIRTRQVRVYNNASSQPQEAKSEPAMQQYISGSTLPVIAAIWPTVIRVRTA